MSFTDKIKYINQLAMVDEFGGRGPADKITKFCIAFRLTDETGNDIELTDAEVEDAVAGKNIVLCDYLSTKTYTLGSALKNPDSCDFVTTSRQYKNNTNLIHVAVREMKTDACLCVTFMDDNSTPLASTTYLSDFPSCFFLNKKPA